jgi:hypothetical protein
VLADGENKVYSGHVWHDPAILNPDEATTVYTCVNDGCPDPGESVMKCKRGYHGPLCGICDSGFFQQVQKCVECPKPQWGLLVGIVLLVATIVAFAVFVLCRRYSRYLAAAQVFAHCKILISFVTVTY